MIDEIIANKENSRRALFEEASGISKYKLRKKQTFSKLKDTEADLSRVEDILFEIDKNLKTLENQAKKAERYYKLKEQYKELSVQLASFRIAGYRNALETLDKQEQDQQAGKSGISSTIDTLEAGLQQQKLAHLTQEKNLSTQQKAANEFIAKIRAYESDKKVKNEQLRFLEDKEARLKEELEKDRQQLNHVDYNQKRLNEELSEEKSIINSLQSDLEKQKSGVDALREQQQNFRTQVDSLVKENGQTQQALNELEKNLAILHIQQDALQQESTRNTSDAQSKEVELNEFNKVLADLAQRLQTQQQELSLAQKLETDLQEKLKVGEEKIQEQKQERQDLNRKLDAKQNEYNLTKSMVDNLEGFPESIRFLKKNTNWAKQAPLFSDILFCKEAYRIAIENYLEPVMNHYVVQTQQEAIQAITLLSDSAQGRANFFILDALKSSVKKTEKQFTKTNLVAALDIIEVDAKYRPLCELLLKNVYVIESGEEEELANTLPQEGHILLSSSGKYSKSTYTMAGGSVGLFEGKRIGRAKNLENLANEISSLAQKITTLQNAIEKESQSLETLRAASQKDQNSQKEQAVQSLNNEYISIKTKQEQYVAFMENSTNRKQDIESKIAGILAEIERSEPKVAELKTEQEIKQQALVQAQQEYQNLSDRLTTEATAYNQENIKFHQQQNKVSGLEKDLDYRNSQHTNLSERIESNHAIFEQTQANIKETLKHVDHSDDDLLAMYSQKEALEKGVEELEQAYYAARGAITETENTIAEQRRKKEQADFLANELKDQKTNLKLELNGLKERLSVEFSIDINDLLENDVPEGENEEALKEKTEKLKRQLDDFGGINPMAMEAYQEMQERFVFIQTQKKDLLDAKDSLLATIKEIDDTAKAKFMEAFTQVREHFIEVFRSLFNEEDSCDLVLSDPENPLDSDIEIMARPKGKRPLSINQLSGGEKTLTATALLFSLYLLKPAPFCIFDEIDAPLDDTNIDKFNTIIRKFSNQSQFIVVSHNKRTIASTDIIYGVTMVEQGVSKVVAVDLREVA